MPGVKVDGTANKVGPSQLPFRSGPPPKAVIRLKGAFVLHTVMVPSVPALGAWFSTTCTVEDNTPHGAVGVTV